MISNIKTSWDHSNTGWDSRRAGRCCHPHRRLRRYHHRGHRGRLRLCRRGWKPRLFCFWPYWVRFKKLWIWTWYCWGRTWIRQTCLNFETFSWSYKKQSWPLIWQVWPWFGLYTFNKFQRVCIENHNSCLNSCNFSLHFNSFSHATTWWLPLLDGISHQLKVR